MLLDYNFNGIVHAGEAGVPDDAMGYRSISDRGLDFSAGVPADPLFDGYLVVDIPGIPDIVHLGNRNTVNGAGQPFDATADMDNIGTQPAWLTNVDQTGPQTTVLANRILLNGSSDASFLFQISNGGGTFDITFDFLSGNSTTAQAMGGDWFQGPFTGTGQVDIANPDQNLNIVEFTIDLSADAGEVLTQITFSNRSNTNAGYAIIAAKVEGCLPCGNAGGVTNLGGGTGPTISTTSRGTLGCDLNATVSNATPGAVGVLAFGFSAANIPLNLALPQCNARSTSRPRSSSRRHRLTRTDASARTCAARPRSGFAGPRSTSSTPRSRWRRACAR